MYLNEMLNKVASGGHAEGGAAGRVALEGAGGAHRVVEVMVAAKSIRCRVSTDGWSCQVTLG
jgi:hypothetical protein